jgi:predicted acetyltransferase
MLPQSFTIVQVEESSDQILSNLFELYLHDMAEWFEFDTTREGNFAFPTQQEVWDKGVDVYFLYSEEIPVGFGLVGSAVEFDAGPNAKDMDEFFVVRRYRRSGIGREFANDLWLRYPGHWLVRVFQKNQPAIPFWRSSISAFTKGRYDEQTTEVNDRPWSYFRFDTDKM